MVRILNKIEELTGLKPIPLQTDEVRKCIVYKYYQVSKFKYRLELRLFDFSFGEVQETEKKVMKICGLGDLNNVSGISHIALNGGGILIDNNTNTVQQLMYFDITIKGE